MKPPKSKAEALTCLQSTMTGKHSRQETIQKLQAALENPDLRQGLSEERIRYLLDLATYEPGKSKE
jgi:hypothetical protein